MYWMRRATATVLWRMGQVKRFILRQTVCRLFGHYSTGTFLWWICDRCHGDFADQAGPSRRADGVKLTRSC